MSNADQTKAFTITYGQMHLINDTRQHLLHLPLWTSHLINSIIMSLPNLVAVSERLYYVPMELYHIFVPFFGAAAAERFLSILTVITVSIGSLINAFKNNDTEAINTETVKLYERTNEMAEFLSKVNPFWTLSQWQSLLSQYIKMTIEEIMDTVSGNYPRAILVYDRLESHTMIIADYVVFGIIEYFWQDRT